jgi:microcystin-dependent protein
MLGSTFGFDGSYTQSSLPRLPAKLPLNDCLGDLLDDLLGVLNAFLNCLSVFITANAVNANNAPAVMAFCLSCHNSRNC